VGVDSRPTASVKHRYLAAEPARRFLSHVGNHASLGCQRCGGNSSTWLFGCVDNPVAVCGCYVAFADVGRAAANSPDPKETHDYVRLNGRNAVNCGPTIESVSRQCPDIS
jgi:hypothetical protein